MFKTRESIGKWLKKMRIQNYTILENLSVNVDGCVYLDNFSLKKIPIQFNIIKEDFWCDNNQLESLEGVPREVGGSFYCYNNQLKSLDYVPQKFKFLISDFGTFTFEEFKEYKRFRDNLKEF